MPASTRRDEDDEEIIVEGGRQHKERGGEQAHAAAPKVTVDGWLVIRVPAASLGPLFLLRQRISACFASKAHPRTAPACVLLPSESAKEHPHHTF